MLQHGDVCRVKCNFPQHPEHNFSATFVLGAHQAIKQVDTLVQGLSNPGDSVSTALPPPASIHTPLFPLASSTPSAFAPSSSSSSPSRQNIESTAMVDDDVRWDVDIVLEQVESSVAKDKNEKEEDVWKDFGTMEVDEKLKVLEVWREKVNARLKDVLKNISSGGENSAVSGKAKEDRMKLLDQCIADYDLGLEMLRTCSVTFDDPRIVAQEDQDIQHATSVGTSTKAIEQKLFISFLLNLTLCHEKKANHCIVQALCDSILRKDPTNVKAWFRRAKAWRAQEFFEAAESDLIRAKDLLQNQDNETTDFGKSELEAVTKELASLEQYVRNTRKQDFIDIVQTYYVRIDSALYPKN